MFCEVAATDSSGGCPFAGECQNRKEETAEAAEMDAVVQGTDEGVTVKVTTKKRRAKAESKFPPFGRCPWPCLSPGLLSLNMQPDRPATPVAAWCAYIMAFVSAAHSTNQLMVHIIMVTQGF